MDEHPDASAVQQLAERARTLLRDGPEDPELRSALELYEADVTNGEPLEPARDQLQRSLDRP